MGVSLNGNGDDAYRLAKQYFSSKTKPKSFKVVTSDSVSTGVDDIRFVTAQDAIEARNSILRDYKWSGAEATISLDEPTPEAAKKWLEGCLNYDGNPFKDED